MIETSLLFHPYSSPRDSKKGPLMPGETGIHVRIIRKSRPLIKVRIVGRGRSLDLHSASFTVALECLLAGDGSMIFASINWEPDIHDGHCQLERFVARPLTRN